jgi:hypothetical protein
VDFSFGQRILAVTDKGRVNVWNGTELTSDTPQHAGLLADLAWNIVLDPNSGTEKVLRALELAQEARDRSVGVAKYDYILGAAHYRAGNHRVAAETLASLSLHHALWVPPRNARFLRFLQRDDQYRWFLAMAQWKLGEKELAKDIFDATYLTIVEDERLRSLADEAAQLLGTSFDQKLQDEQDQRNRFADEFRRSGFRGQQRSPSELAAVLIAARDQDGDETISEDEMRDLMRPRFPEFDIDKSGELDREELITMFERSALTGPTGARQTDWLLRNLEPVLMSRDSNGDGVVTEEESPPFLWRLYGLHDANGDGKLELDEVRKSLEAAAAKQDE